MSAEARGIALAAAGGAAARREGCEYDRLHRMVAHAFDRVTTDVRLIGAGTDGRGVPRGRAKVAWDDFRINSGPSTCPVALENDAPTGDALVQHQAFGTPETLGCNVGHD
jgi:hypothetical protein